MSWIPTMSAFVLSIHFISPLARPEFGIAESIKFCVIARSLCCPGRAARDHTRVARERCRRVSKLVAAEEAEAEEEASEPVEGRGESAARTATTQRSVGTNGRAIVLTPRKGEILSEGEESLKTNLPIFKWLEAVSL